MDQEQAPPAQAITAEEAKTFLVFGAVLVGILLGLPFVVSVVVSLLLVLWSSIVSGSVDPTRFEVFVMVATAGGLCLIIGYTLKNPSAIGWRRPSVPWDRFGLYFALALALSFGVGWLYEALGGPVGQEDVRAFLTKAANANAITALGVFAAAAIMYPVVEEITFRGYLQTGLDHFVPAWASTLLLSALFAAIHFDISVFLPLFTFGLIASGLTRLTGSLWAPISLHMVNNAMFFLVLKVGTEGP